MIFISLLFALPQVLFAIDAQQAEIFNASVVDAPASVVEESVWEDGPQRKVQHIKVNIDGKAVELENEFHQLSVGDRVFVERQHIDEQGDIFELKEINRTKPLIIIAMLFVFVLLAFGGAQGARSLIALAGSVVAIIFVLIPLIIAGYNPVTVSIIVASAILFMAIFLTHGFNRVSAIALVGTVIAVLFTGFIAYFAIHIAMLTGMSDETHTFLNISTGGTLDFVGLLLGAIIIGALGALDDVAITQVAVVRELVATGKKMAFRDMYNRAMRVGKEHVGALVNTLVLAYTGASLPLLLLYAQSQSSVPFMHIEQFATEIVRMLVGSIGLIITVPITTVLAVYFMRHLPSEYFDTHKYEHGHTHNLNI